MVSPKRAYLTLYNFAVLAGWAQVLFLTVKTLIHNNSQQNHLAHGLYDAVSLPLALAQSAAILEIIHSVVGIVRSPVTATLPQVASRLYVTWGILCPFPEIRTSPFLISLLISWSLTEIVRYSFFGLKELVGYAPRWLLWLRYSMFLVLYPTGISSEVGLIYNAMPYMKESGRFSLRMPNKWNFGFDYYYNAFVVLGFYVPGSPHLYGYMLGQRKKALSKAKNE